MPRARYSRKGCDATVRVDLSEKVTFKQIAEDNANWMREEMGETEFLGNCHTGGKPRLWGR